MRERFAFMVNVLGVSAPSTDLSKSPGSGIDRDQNSGVVAKGESERAMTATTALLRRALALPRAGIHWYGKATASPGPHPGPSSRLAGPERGRFSGS